MRIDRPEQVVFDSLRIGLAPVRITKFKTFVTAFYNYAIENLNLSDLTPDDWNRTVSISSGKIGPKIKKLSADEKDTVFCDAKVYAESR